MGQVLAEVTQQTQGAYRRALDKQGWSNDITLLRRQAAAVDRRLCQMRLKDRLAGAALFRTCKS